LEFVSLASIQMQVELNNNNNSNNNSNNSGDVGGRITVGPRLAFSSSMDVPNHKRCFESINKSNLIAIKSMMMTHRWK